MKSTILCPLIAVLALLGCAGPPEGSTIPVRELPPIVAPPPPETAVTEEPNPLADLNTLRKSAENKLIAAEQASECPMVDLRTLQGQQTELQLGRAGYVTLVVFWAMDTPQSQACVKHISDLVGRYSQFGVRAVGVVEPTRYAEDAPDFAARHELAMPLYYDSLRQTALRKLAGEVGAKQERAVPAVFIIDRRLKLRFYRPGFRHFRRSALMPDGTGVIVIGEDVPEDQTIEHFLKQILKESW